MNEECPFCHREDAYHNGVCYYCPNCDREWGDDISEYQLCPKCNSDRFYINTDDKYDFTCEDCNHSWNKKND